ncbi:hypothetical protein PAHAL_3G429700 [Panicum hallii]|uniref:Uncharacterized protein n=1 Tax=Panicum hallii TaxID=206008 RepID=A0A2S3HDZ3_9POAL|nr:hypothetical protein PAHAL_3G429700 [Panicum hallii]
METNFLRHRVMASREAASCTPIWNLDPAVAVLGPSVPWAPAACSAAQPQASSPCQFLSLQSEILAGRIWRCKRPAVLFSSSLKSAPVLYLPSQLLFFQSSNASTDSRHHAAASWTR